MSLGKIFVILLSPLCILLIFCVIKTSSYQCKKMSDEKFIIFLPKIVAIIGLIGSLLAFVVFIVFVFFSQQKLNWIFYFVFSIMFGVGAYLVLKTSRFKIVINKNIIKVTPVLSKNYCFTFQEIIFAERQIKNNKTNSERIILKTRYGKKLIVENTEVSYERFLRRITSEVNSRFLKGFGQSGDGSVIDNSPDN